MSDDWGEIRSILGNEDLSEAEKLSQARVIANRQEDVPTALSMQAYVLNVLSKQHTQKLTQAWNEGASLPDEWTLPSESHDDEGYLANFQLGTHHRWRNSITFQLNHIARIYTILGQSCPDLREVLEENNPDWARYHSHNAYEMNHRDVPDFREFEALLTQMIVNYKDEERRSEYLPPREDRFWPEGD